MGSVVVEKSNTRTRSNSQPEIRGKLCFMGYSRREQQSPSNSAMVGIITQFFTLITELSIWRRKTPHKRNIPRISRSRLLLFFWAEIILCFSFHLHKNFKEDSYAFPRTNNVNINCRLFRFLGFRVIYESLRHEMREIPFFR